MAFLPSRRFVPRPPVRSTPVMAVGQRVFVNSPGNRSGSVALGDASGKIQSAVYLSDGSEVEVLAWRPRGASDTRYRVRALHGADGWLPADNLRTALVPPPPPESSTPEQTSAAQSAAADAAGRAFGQRAHAARPSSYAPSTLAQPSPAAAGGRRFGQHSETEPPSAPASPAPSGPAPAIPGGGRRFGQYFEDEAHAPRSVTPSEPAPTAGNGGRRFGQH